MRYVYEVVNKEGLGVFFLIQDVAPFLNNYKQDSIIFSIADNYMFDNCEMLFLADDCYCNGKKQYSFYRTNAYYQFHYSIAYGLWRRF